MASFASTFPYFILIQPYLHSCHIRAHKTAFNISTFYVSYFHFLKCSSSKTRLLYSSFTFITYFHKWDILNEVFLNWFAFNYIPSANPLCLSLPHLLIFTTTLVTIYGIRSDKMFLLISFVANLLTLECTLHKVGCFPQIYSHAS